MASRSDPEVSHRLPILGLLLLITAGCSTTSPDASPPPPVDRLALIPSGATKVLPADDATPPVLHSVEFTEPIPVPVINTAGAEDAPFIPAGEDVMYFFFAGDPNLDPPIQVRDPGNGIWVSERLDGTWQEPTLVRLQDPGQLALNGCPAVSGDEMLFCTARDGLAGLHWFRAERVDGAWSNWALVDYPAAFEVGELHVHGDLLYFGSSRPGGLGGEDIWTTTRVDGSWTEPVNVAAANSPVDDTRPFVSADGSELWITRWHEGSPAIFRSLRVDGEWQEAELIVSRLAGEPTLDAEGNLYFVHHFLADGEIVEADIYVAARK